MQAQQDDAGVQERCCRMLCHSGCKLHHVSETIRDCLVTMIISAMATHKDNAGVQEQGCGALKGLADANLWTDVILEAMAVHQDHTGVQARASQLLSQVTSMAADQNAFYRLPPLTGEAKKKAQERALVLLGS
jgi:hypothetical protein